MTTRYLDRRNFGFALLSITALFLAVNAKAIAACDPSNIPAAVPSVPFPDFESGQVFIPNGKRLLTSSMLEQTRLSQLFCLNGTDDCLYRYPSWCGKPQEVANNLSADIFACRGVSDAPRPPKKSVGKVFPNSILYPMHHRANARPRIDRFGKDELFQRQRALQKMGAEQAWLPAEQGFSASVLTAIIDTGVDLDHPDLVKQFVEGFDVPCASVACNGGNPNGLHGTSMAGIVAAARFNGGTIGTAWNTKFLPIRISANNASAFEHQTIVAIRRALSRGAKVINLSFGSASPTEALRNELENTPDDFIIVVPAGNSGVSTDVATEYPAAYALDKMLVVMSHDRNGHPEGSSSWGANVDIAAPGDATYPIPCEGSNASACYESSADSTSIATAYVSGAAALLWSLHPEWSAADIKGHILSTADFDSNLTGCMVKPLRLNLARMMLPVFFDAAKGPSIEKSKLAYVNSTKAFPDGMCSDIATTLVRPGDPAATSVAIDKLQIDTPVQIVARCTRSDGIISSVRSIAYQVTN